MPASLTATPPPNVRENLLNERNIKEKQVENNFTFSIFYLEVFWWCYRGSKWCGFWWRAPKFVPNCRDINAKQLPN